ncbi:MAG: 50S ribosomal protein L24 [Dongiaceae bacterium]
MKAKFKIKKDDEVIVRSGKDRGKKGKVLEVLRAEHKILVKGVNMVKRHTKPSAAGGGGIVEKELPLAISKVALIDPKSGKATRAGYKIAADGSKQRIAKKSGQVIAA